MKVLIACEESQALNEKLAAALREGVVMADKAERFIETASALLATEGGDEDEADNQEAYDQAFHDLKNSTEGFQQIARDYFNFR